MLTNLSKSQKIYDVIVFYENAQRLVRTFDDLEKFGINIEQIIICRELTKIYEQIIRGSVEEIKQYFEQNRGKLKGEVTVIAQIR